MRGLVRANLLHGFSTLTKRYRRMQEKLELEENSPCRVARDETSSAHGNKKIFFRAIGNYGIPPVAVSRVTINQHDSILSILRSNQTLEILISVTIMKNLMRNHNEYIIQTDMLISHPGRWTKLWLYWHYGHMNCGFDGVGILSNRSAEINSCYDEHEVCCIWNTAHPTSQQQCVYVCVWSWI